MKSGKVSFKQGSSPRMRGARGGSHLPSARRRIIPADAGSTRVITLPATFIRDHPRGCGEHLYQILKWVGLAGSSPRMRGALHLLGQGRRVQRIIPADAGSTISRHAHDLAGEDHPRGCGEHQTLRSHPERPAGSSPRMRGALPRWVHGFRVRRIIPADAGSTDSQ